MSSAIFVCPFPPETTLPPFQSDDGYQLHYTDPTPVMVDGVPTYPLRGGYSLIGLTPQADTCEVRVWCSEAVLAQMKSDGRYLWKEDVEEATVE